MTKDKKKDERPKWMKIIEGTHIVVKNTVYEVRKVHNLPIAVCPKLSTIEDIKQRFSFRYVNSVGKWTKWIDYPDDQIIYENDQPPRAQCKD